MPFVKLASYCTSTTERTRCQVLKSIKLWTGLFNQCCKKKSLAQNPGEVILQPPLQLVSKQVA